MAAEFELEVGNYHRTIAEPLEHQTRPRNRLTTGWSMRSTRRSLKAIRSSSLNGRFGHSGSPSDPSAANISYAPRLILAFTRSQLFIARSAASCADRCQTFVLPSWPGSRTGQMKTTPWRLIAVYKMTGTHSPTSADAICLVTT